MTVPPISPGAAIEAAGGSRPPWCTVVATTVMPEGVTGAVVAEPEAALQQGLDLASAVWQSPTAIRLARVAHG